MKQRRQMDPAEVIQLLQKLQDPVFRKQAQQGLTLMCSAVAALVTLITLVLTVALAHHSFTAGVVGAIAVTSGLNGFFVGRLLSRRILRAFQQKIKEKAGIPNLFGKL
ncbi:MAG: hypothetical protein U0931_38870 [Vulcanimicrobiota bacterium]